MVQSLRRPGRAWSQALHSSTWRLALLYMAVFLVSVSLLLAFIYWSTAGYMARQADTTILTEAQGLAEQYRQRGFPGLVAVVHRRVARSPQGDSIYLFATPDLTVLAGNLDRWPEVAPEEGGWITFRLTPSTDGADAPPERGDLARARVYVLSGGARLLVGRNIQELEEVRGLVVKAIGWGLALTAALAAAGGMLMSWRTAKRIEAINETSREIMRGDLSQRVPTRGSGDDFDQLAENLNAMLERIQELMAGVREVSDNVAHDLKTPLARLRTRLEALHASAAREAASGGESSVPELADAALAEADRLLAMFDAVLRIARIETGAQRARAQQLDLGRVLRDVYELYEPLAEDQRQRMVLDAPSKLALRGDPELVFQALSNLVDNALKYTPSGGAVSLSARALDGEDGRAEVVVADSGPGIPPADRERVFRRFHRLESSRSTPGNGLGLSLVAAVARLHGGEVRLENNEPTGLRARLVLCSQGAAEGTEGEAAQGSERGNAPARAKLS